MEFWGNYDTSGPTSSLIRYVLYQGLPAVGLKGYPSLNSRLMGSSRFALLSISNKLARRFWRADRRAALLFAVSSSKRWPLVFMVSC